VIEFGREMRALRESAIMSQAELAALDPRILNQRSICRWEGGHHVPLLSTALRILALLDGRLVATYGSRVRVLRTNDDWRAAFWARRLAARLTQVDVGELLCPPAKAQVVGRWETGRTELSVERACSVLEAVGYSVRVVPATLVEERVEGTQQGSCAAT